LLNTNNFNFKEALRFVDVSGVKYSLHSHNMIIIKITFLYLKYQSEISYKILILILLLLKGISLDNNYDSLMLTTNVKSEISSLFKYHTN